MVAVCVDWECGDGSRLDCLELLVKALQRPAAAAAPPSPAETTSGSSRVVVTCLGTLLVTSTWEVGPELMTPTEPEPGQVPTPVGSLHLCRANSMEELAT